MAVTFIYYRYIIIPMKKKHLEEEKNLKLEQAELMALFASLSPDPVFRFDPSGLIILANNSAHNILPGKNLVGDQAQKVLPFVNDHDIKEVISNNLTISDTALLGGRYFQFIIEGVSKFQVCQVYGRDITDLKNTERDLKEALIRAEDAKRMKEFFLAQISHEIRSPLNVIVGYSDLLADELKDEKKDEYTNILRSMKNNSKRLYRTFDLLLNVSQLQTGRYDARFELVDLHSLLKTLQNEFLSMAEEKNLSLELTNSINEEVSVIVDHYALAQIFMNLFDNAIKYTDKGWIKVNIYQSGPSVCVDVSDSGKGISKEYIDKLFIPFTQEEMGYTRRYDGTGLGLSMIKSFIDINKAKIKVKSEINHGTTFTVILNGEKRWGTPRT
ncbi:MAG: HAMP domain-containing sensor histidine kinase [Ignavibacteriales bacterium]|nr:HAMP domain-containing sensor histidine kinase [Ignavibacteriales bacterium]